MAGKGIGRTDKHKPKTTVEIKREKWKNMAWEKRRPIERN